MNRKLGKELSKVTETLVELGENPEVAVEIRLKILEATVGLLKLKEELRQP